MAGIKEYSLTASSNSAINSISIAEGCAPSGINDAIRQEMADTRAFYECGGWIDLGLTHTYSSGTAVTVASDVTASYVAGRRVKAVGSGTGTIYGVVASSSYSAPNTTINFTWDSGSLSNETLTVYAGWIAPTGYPINSTAIKGIGGVSAIIAGAGLSGGTISTSGTIALDIGSLTAETAPATDDFLALLDTSEGAPNKISLANILTIINALTADTAPDKAADYVMTYDASASAVKKVLLNQFPTFKVGSFTRDTSTASGTQAVTGVGFKPRMILFLANRGGTSEFSIGWDDGSASTSVANFYAVTAGAWSANTTKSIYLVQNGTDVYEGKISTFDADGFTMSWTKTASKTGTANIYYLAIA